MHQKSQITIFLQNFKRFSLGSALQETMIQAYDDRVQRGKTRTTLLCVHIELMIVLRNNLVYTLKLQIDTFVLVELLQKVFK